MSDFEVWWYSEGSGIRPYGIEDVSEFAKRICEVAWENGAYIERLKLKSEGDIDTPQGV